MWVASGSRYFCQGRIWVQFFFMLGPLTDPFFLSESNTDPGFFVIVGSGSTRRGSASLDFRILNLRHFLQTCNDLGICLFISPSSTFAFIICIHYQHHVLILDGNPVYVTHARTHCFLSNQTLKQKKYKSLLLTCALISELPYDISIMLCT